MVDKRYLPAKSNLLGGLIIRCIKNVGKPSEKYKARFVVQGHRDSEKKLLIHDTATLRQASLPIILSVASAFTLDAWSLDITQACTCSKPSTRLFYVRPDSSFGISPNLVFPIVRPLYRLENARDE